MNLDGYKFKKQKLILLNELLGRNIAINRSHCVQLHQSRTIRKMLKDGLIKMGRTQKYYRKTFLKKSGSNYSYIYITEKGKEYLNANSNYR